MSLRASSYSFPLESVAAAAYSSLFAVVRCGLIATTIVRKPALFPGLLFSRLNLLTMLRRVPATNVNRGPNCSMNILRAQDQ